MSHLVDWFDNKNSYQNKNYNLNQSSGRAYSFSYGSDALVYYTNTNNYYSFNNGIGMSYNTLTAEGISVENINSNAQIEVNNPSQLVFSLEEPANNPDTWVAFKATGRNLLEIQIFRDGIVAVNPYVDQFEGEEILEYQAYQSYDRYLLYTSDNFVCNHIYSGNITYIVSYGCLPQDIDYSKAFSVTGGRLDYEQSLPERCTIFFKFLPDVYYDLNSISINVGKFQFNEADITDTLAEKDCCVYDSAAAGEVYQVTSNGKIQITAADYRPSNNNISIVNNNNSNPLGLEYLIIFNTRLTDEQIIWVYNNMIKK